MTETTRTSIDLPDEWQRIEGDELIKMTTEKKALLLNQVIIAPK